MTGCEFGDVILVPFPFTDQSALQDNTNPRDPNSNRAVRAAIINILNPLLDD